MAGCGVSPADAHALLGIARARLSLYEAAAALDPLNTNPQERIDLEVRIAQLTTQVFGDNPQPYRADTDEGRMEMEEA